MRMTRIGAAGVILAATAGVCGTLATSQSPAPAPAQPKYDLLLRGGHVIDARNAISAVRDVAISGGTVAAVAAKLNPAEALKTVDVSGLYVVPGLIDAALIRRIAEGSPLPVNVMSAPGLPPLRVLQESGVARISHGPGPYRMLMQALTSAARNEYEQQG